MESQPKIIKGYNAQDPKVVNSWIETADYT